MDWREESLDWTVGLVASRLIGHGLNSSFPRVLFIETSNSNSYKQGTLVEKS